MNGPVRQQTLVVPATKEVETGWSPGVTDKPGQDSQTLIS
jgi:hypothetical protein